MLVTFTLSVGGHIRLAVRLVASLPWSPTSSSGGAVNPIIKPKEESMGTNGYDGTDDQPKNEKLMFRGTAEDKATLEVLADHVFDCSQSAVLRKLIRDAKHEILDGVDPQAIQDGDVTLSELDDLVNGDASGDEIQPDTDTGTGQAVADGGSVPAPSSYTANLTPAQLAKSGPELSWNELREYVADPEDGGLWSDSLEIHPDRVGETTLKQSHKTTTRILAAICRSEAYSGVLQGDTDNSDTDLNVILDTYVSDLHSRLDSTAGKDYFRETYRELLEDNFLYPLPMPDKDAYYVTQARARKGLETTIEESIDALDHEFADRVDEQQWRQNYEVEGGDSHLAWCNVVADELRECVAPLRVIHSTGLAEVADTLDYPDEYQHISHYLANIVSDALDQYRKDVSADDRRTIEEEILADSVVDALQL